MKKVVVAAAGTAAILLGALAFNAAADDSSRSSKSDQTTTSERPPAPPRPDWVRDDGTIDQSKMPEELPIMGPDGKVVKDANGKPRMAKVRGNLKPPRPPAEGASNLKAGENRSTGKDEDGRPYEELEIKPTVPPAN